MATKLHLRIFLRRLPALLAICLAIFAMAPFVACWQYLESEWRIARIHANTRPSRPRAPYPPPRAKL